jgi:hypothetical protein
MLVETNESASCTLRADRMRRTFVLWTGSAIVLWLQSAVCNAAVLEVTLVSAAVSDDGECSLAEAMIAANEDRAVDVCAAGSGNDDIVLPAGTFELSGTPENDTLLPAVRDDVVIRGMGADATVLRRAPGAPPMRAINIQAPFFEGVAVFFVDLALEDWGGEFPGGDAVG